MWETCEAHVTTRVVPNLSGSQLPGISEVKLFIPIQSCCEWSEQVLQHCSGLQLVHRLLAINLLAGITVITQLLYCPENPNVFATAAAPFDEIDDVDVTAADGLFSSISAPAYCER